MIFNVHQAKTQLSKILQIVEAGEEVVLARRNKPVATIRAVAVAKPAAFEQPTRRVPGRLKDQIDLTDAFFEPLPEDELRAWEGD